MEEFTYPPARRLELTEDLFGHQVSDPYRWLEDGTSAERAGWLAAQAELFGSYRGELPGRDRLAAQGGELLSTGPMGAPGGAGGREALSRAAAAAPNRAPCRPRAPP